MSLACNMLTYNVGPLIKAPIRDDMELLVTGGAGYIGSIVCQHLLSAGHDVTVLDNLERGYREAVPLDIELIEADLRDPEQMRSALSRGYDGVLHFAAYALVSESVVHPGLYFHNNVGGTLNLLNAMVEFEVPRIVFSSTCAVYGQPEELPVREDTPTRPANPYGASKLAADHLIASYCHRYPLTASSLRYFNAAGAHNGLGELHEPETHLIPNVLQVALGIRPAVSVFGTDYKTVDGTAVRDYVHVDDLASAHLLALERVNGGPHRVLNLGTGVGFSVLEVIAAVRQVTGRQIPTILMERRSGDPALLVAAPDRACNELGWAPARSSIETMIADAWSFATEHPTGY